MLPPTAGIPPTMHQTGLDFSFLASILCFPELRLTNIKTLLQFISNFEFQIHSSICTSPSQIRKERHELSHHGCGSSIGLASLRQLVYMMWRTGLLRVTEFKVLSPTTSPRFYSPMHIDEKEQASPKEEEGMQ